MASMNRLSLLEDGYEETAPDIYERGNVRLNLAAMLGWRERHEEADARRSMVAAGLVSVVDAGAAGIVIEHDIHGRPRALNLNDLDYVPAPEHVEAMHAFYKDR